MPKHPAPFSATILKLLDEIVPAGLYLDPFAGTGRVYLLSNEDRAFVGIELEEGWDNAHPDIAYGDFLELGPDFERVGFDGVVTSPVYGNRMSDHHNAKDASSRTSYRHNLGRDLQPNNAGTLYFWQDAYKQFHLAAWELCWKLTRDGGLMFLNVSDFIRNGERQRCVLWHMRALRGVGYEIVHVHHIETPRMRNGENSEARVPYEVVIEAKKVVV